MFSFKGATEDLQASRFHKYSIIVSFEVASTGGSENPASELKNLTRWISEAWQVHIPIVGGATYLTKKHVSNWSYRAPINSVINE